MLIKQAVIAAFAVLVASPALAACADGIPIAQRRIPPDWLKVVGENYSHPKGPAMNFQCNDGDPLYAYIQVPVEGTDISDTHPVIAALAKLLLIADVGQKDVETCILKVMLSRPNDDADTWRAVARFGKAFECGKDQYSHFFRITPTPEG